MMRLLVGLVALTATLPAATPSWSYAPLVTYEDEAATVMLSPAVAGDGWRVVDQTDVLADAPILRDGHLILAVPPRWAQLLLRASDGRTCALRFVRPGEARDLVIDGHGHPLIAGVRVVLVLSRLEARADRRWGMLRESTDRAPKPCALMLPAPTGAEGVPLLTAQVRDAQALAVRGQGVLIELAAADRFAGWKHREYRQCLAWLVADLQARGAAHIALAPPVAARPFDDDLLPLRHQVADVAAAYRCRLVEVEALSDPACWLVSPGVFGLTLNPSGEARRAAILAPWRAR